MQNSGLSHRALEDVQGKFESAGRPRQTLGCSGLQAFTSGALLTQTLSDFLITCLIVPVKKKEKEEFVPSFQTGLQERTVGSAAIKSENSVR